jgi:transcriptional regulator with XRE-family HTH domain
LNGRNGQIWRAYVAGHTQQKIADDFGLSQQHVSQIVAAVREDVPPAVREDAALLAVERTDALLAAVWDDAMAGDTKAVLAALRVLERMARALGTDAVEPLRVTLERRNDLEGDVVASAITAAVEALGLGEESRVLALQAAVTRLSVDS